MHYRSLHVLDRAVEQILSLDTGHSGHSDRAQTPLLAHESISWQDQHISVIHLSTAPSRSTLLYTNLSIRKGTTGNEKILC